MAALISDGQALGEFLRERREKLGLSLRQVEQITGGSVSNAYLSQVETGKIEAPSIVMLHRLAAAYALGFAELCERAVSGNRPPAPPPLCPTCGQVLP